MTNFRMRRDGLGQNRDDSGAAMITALLAILITAMFAIVMLGVLLSQIKPTQLQQATTRTVFAAEAGLNVVVGQIRNAEDAPDGSGNVYGKRSLLPCTSTGPVSSGGSDSSYLATITYFTENPTGKSTSWKASHKLVCSSGYGPSKDPTHALISSSGIGVTPVTATGTIDRTIEVVYAFQITNSNIPGGYIYSWDKNINIDRFCLSATAVAVGANIKYIAAVDCGENDARQLWVYAPDYRIKLAATTVPDFGGDPLCITATPNGGTPVPATLEVCKPASSAARWNQLWSWEGGANWRGQQDPISSGYSGGYLSSGSKSTPTVGSLLQVWNQAGNNLEWGSYNPDPRVGAGAAGSATHQLVNYLEFGRCADVTHGSTSEPQMIAYPCKQDPNPAQTQLNWNHKWFYDEVPGKLGTLGPQFIYVMEGNTSKRCLKAANSEGGFVTFSTTCSTSDTSLKWTRYAEAGAYDTSWVFKDGYGRCLDLGPWYKQGTSDQEAWSTLVSRTCNGGLAQKWNAPAMPGTAVLGGYWEVP